MLKLVWKIFVTSLKFKILFHRNINKFKAYYDNIDVTPIMYFDLCRNYLFFNIVIKLYYFYLFDNFLKLINLTETVFIYMKTNHGKNH